MQNTTSEWIEVKKSKIHNLGVYAVKDILKGTKIIEYVGRKISKQESDEIYEKTLEISKSNSDYLGSVYIFTLNKNYDIDGNVYWNTARLINHSCDPNCETDIIKGVIWITSIKNIKKGEEIFYDYGYDLSDYENHPCKCESKNCIGYITNQENWIKLRKKLKWKNKKGKREKLSN